MKKKILITGLVVLCIAAILACKLPWPTRYTLTMHGAQVTPEGAVIQEGDIVISGWKLNYLLEKDQLKFETLQLPGITLPKKLTNKQNILNGQISDYLSDRYDLVYTTVYLPEQNEFTSLHFFLSKDAGWCVIQEGFNNGYRYFAGSLQEDFDPAALLEICGLPSG